MMTSVRGVYRDGRVELAEPIQPVENETAVIVTFLAAAGQDLRAHGISPEQAAELRARLASFAEDWNSPEMAIYDHYDASRGQS